MCKESCETGVNERKDSSKQTNLKKKVILDNAYKQDRRCYAMYGKASSERTTPPPDSTMAAKSISEKGATACGVRSRKAS